MNNPSPRAAALSISIINCALEVHRILGPGHCENIYRKALAVELDFNGLPSEKRKRVSILYKGKPVGEGLIDLVIENEIIIQIKAVDSLTPDHTAQVMSYLKASKIGLGLLINFNSPLLKQGLKRIVHTF